MIRRPATLGSKATGGSDCWRTPAAVLDAVRRYAPIECDPCAADDARHHYARRNIPAALDGLACEWTRDGRLTFANIPYSEAAPWTDKAIAEAQLGSSVIMLVAARPGARWYRRAKAHADVIGEVRGRLTFVGAPTSAPFPSALIGLNVSWRRFVAAFGPIADCEVPSTVQVADERATSERITTPRPARTTNLNTPPREST